jgi:hypothetical protein
MAVIEVADFLEVVLCFVLVLLVRVFVVVIEVPRVDFALFFLQFWFSEVVEEVDQVDKLSL